MTNNILLIKLVLKIFLKTVIIKQKIKVLLEELNAIDLKRRIDMVMVKLKNEISLLKNNNRQQTLSGNKQLKSLTEDFQQLVQVARNAMMKTVSPEIRVIVNKIEKIWTTEIYPLIKEYDKRVDEYNKRNNTNLQHISKRTNNEINNSIKTKYFNY